MIEQPKPVITTAELIKIRERNKKRTSALALTDRHNLLNEIDYLNDEIAELKIIVQRVKDLKANIINDPACSCGSVTSVCNWYTIAPCNFGEAVDDAIAAWEQT